VSAEARGDQLGDHLGCVVEEYADMSRLVVAPAA
jgi:hypothetical protein